MYNTHFFIDSTIFFSKKMIKKLKNINVCCFGLHDTTNDKSYTTDIDELPNTKLKKMYDEGVRFKTSMPNQEITKNKILNILKNDENASILFYCINSRYSGTYDSVKNIIKNLPVNMKNRIEALEQKNFLIYGLNDFLSLYKLKINNIKDYITYNKNILKGRKSLCAIMCSIKDAKKSGRFSNVLYRITFVKLQLNMVFAFLGEKESIHKFISIKRTFYGAIKSIYNYYEKNNLLNNKNNIILYYSMRNNKILEKLISILSTVFNDFKITPIYMPNIYGAATGEQYLVDIIDNKRILEIIHEYT